MGYRIWSILGLMLCCLNLHAQNWNLVWREDFGVAEDTVIKDFPNASMTVPRHSFAAYESIEHRNNMGVIDYHEKGGFIGECGYIDDGQYGIANSTRWAYQRFSSCKDKNGSPLQDGGHFVGGRDHTGNKNGAMMIVNSEVGTGLPIYQQEIEFDLCDSREYKFVIYASSVTTYNENGGNANLELKVVNTNTGDIVESIQTGDIPFWQFDGWGDSKGGRADATAQREWTEYATKPFTVNNGDRLQLQVTNWGSGFNDFVIDDISLYRNDDVTIIDPTISSNTISSENTAVAGSCIFNASFEVPESVLTSWKKVYDHVYFLWQRSKDDGLTWSNELEVSGINQLSAQFEVSAEEQEVYRVIITGSASESEAKEQALYIAEHGGPKDGCSYYSISNTLAGVSPTPDCSYNKNLRTLWRDDLGLLGEKSRKSSPEVKLSFYSGNTDALSMGEYAIVSNPATALKNNSWDKESEMSDASGMAGGAMIYTKLDKSAGDDDKDLIYEKVLSGQLCPCKSMCFSFFAFDRNEWAGETLLGRVVTEKGDIIGETTLEITHDNSRQWVQCSVPFTLPQNNKENIRLQILNKTKQNYNVKIALDNFSVYICGETAPQGEIQIDGHPTIAYLGGEECDEKNNTLSISDDASWKRTYPNYGFAWQKSTDGGASWTFAGNEKSITHQNSQKKLCEYRVIFAETQAAAEQAAKNGLPDDPCLVFGYSNLVGIECETEPCKAPQFELKSDTFQIICSDREEPVVIEVEQLDEANIDKMQWFSKAYNSEKWVAIEQANESTLSISDFETDSTDYLFLAYNDTCVSDSVLFRLNIHKKMELLSIDTTICEGSDLLLKAQFKEKGSTPTEYIWNGASHPMGEAKISNVKRAQIVTLSANNGYCFAPEVDLTIHVEEYYNPVWGVNEVTGCKDSTEGFLFIVKNADNGKEFYRTHTSTWEQNGEQIGEDFSLEYTFTENTTLTHTVTGTYCPAVSFDFAIHVVTTPQLTLEANKREICENGDLVLTATTEHAEKLIWHFRSEEASGDEIINNETTDELKLQPQKSGSYFITTPDDGICGKVKSKEVYVSVQKELNFEFNTIPSVVCEGTDVELSATSLGGEATSMQWSKDDHVINENLNATDQPTESCTYQFKAQSDACPTFSESFEVTISNPTQLILTTGETVVCQEEKILLSTENKDISHLQWQSSTDGKSFTTFAEEASPSQTFQPSDAEKYYFRLAADNGTCGISYSDTVEVSVVKPLNFEITELPASICAGEEVALTATSSGATAKSINWTRNGLSIGDELSTTDAPTENSSYTFTAESEACPTFTQTWEVEVDNPSTLTLETQEKIVCEGSSIHLSAELGETKKVSWQVSTDSKRWENFSQALTTSQTFETEGGDILYFRLESENEGRCKTGYSNLVKVAVERKVELDSKRVSTGICEGNTTELSFEAELGPLNTIIWECDGAKLPDQTSTITVSPKKESLYTLTIKGEQCPSVSKEYQVEIQPQPILSISCAEQTLCAGEEATLELTANHPLEFSWTMTNDKNEATNLGGTQTSLTVSMTESATFQAVAAAGNYCEGATSNEIRIEVEKPIEIDLIEKQNICEGDEAQINAVITGIPDKITWYKRDSDDDERVKISEGNHSLEVTPTLSTEYTIECVSEKCASIKASTVVIVESVAPMGITLSDDSICGGGTVTLLSDYPDPEQIVWEKRDAKGGKYTVIEKGMAEITLSPEQTELYRVSATSKAGCVSTPAQTTIHVFQPSNLALEDKTICLGDSVRMRVEGYKGEGELMWFSSADNFANEISTQQTFIVKPKFNTDYKVVVVNGKCVSEASATVRITTPPIVLSSEETSLGTYELEVESATFPVYFDYGKGATTSNRIEDVVYGQSYDIIVSTDGGCSTHYILETPIYDIAIPEYFVPGEHNWVVENIERFPKATVQIYDRFGKKLVQLKSDSEGWDGTYNGRPLPATDYWYIINVPEIDRQFNGHFTLIRGN